MPPVYVGDDVTDEDAFRALAGRGISLVVRDPDDRPTAADYALADPDDVKRFLQSLTAAAATSDGRPARSPGSVNRPPDRTDRAHRIQQWLAPLERPDAGQRRLGNVRQGLVREEPLV